MHKWYSSHICWLIHCDLIPRCSRNYIIRKFDFIWRNSHNTCKDFWYIKNPSITKLYNLKNSLSQSNNASAYLNNGNLTASNHSNFFLRFIPSVLAFIKKGWERVIKRTPHGSWLDKWFYPTHYLSISTLRSRKTQLVEYILIIYLI